MKEKNDLSGIIDIFRTLRNNIDELLRTDVSKLYGHHPEFDFNNKITAPINALRRELVSKQAWVGEDYCNHICIYCDKLLAWVKEYRYHPVASSYSGISNSVEAILAVIRERGQRIVTYSTENEQQKTTLPQQELNLGTTMAEGDSLAKKEASSAIAAQRIITKYGLRI